MRNVLRAILAVLAGIAVGASSGALILGLPLYLSTETGFFGPASNWAGLAAIIGAICGGALGVVTGIITVLSKAGRRVGAIIGACAGLSVLIILVVEGADRKSTRLNSSHE